MKVFCINSDGWMEQYKLLWLFKSWRACSGPDYGDIVTVSNSYYEEGELYYVLIEWPCNDEGFLAECFIPLSDIDEMELLEERESLIKELK